jgi:hypothetical protein
MDTLPTSLADEFTKDQLKTGMDWLVENYSKFYNIGNFAKITDQNTVDSYIGQACHASTAYSVNRKGKTIDLIVTENGYWRRFHEGSKQIGIYTDEGDPVSSAPFSKKLPESWKSTEIIRPFITWLTQESYMAPLFVPVGIDFMLQYGFVLRTNVAFPLLQNALIATRNLLEVGPAAFEYFNKYKSMGMNGDFLFAMIFCSTVSSHQYYYGSGSIYRENKAHHFEYEDTQEFWIKRENETQVGYGSVTTHRTHYPFELADMVKYYLPRKIGKPTDDGGRLYKSNVEGKQSYWGGQVLFSGATSLHPVTSAATWETRFKDDPVNMKKLRELRAELKAKNGLPSAPIIPNPFAPRSTTRNSVFPVDKLTRYEVLNLLIPWAHDLTMAEFNKEASNVRAA